MHGNSFFKKIYIGNTGHMYAENNT